jgi:hypothetical protein
MDSSRQTPNVHIVVVDLHLGEQIMMKPRINVLSLIFLCLIISAAQAQVTIDVSKITCQQFRSYAITDPNNIALWLSGYYNGQRKNTIIKVESFKENLEKVKDYCITHQAVTVMQAVEAILDVGK